MAYRVVINIDYARHSAERCAEIWQAIANGMTQAGFRPDGRAFATSLPEQEAVALARAVMERVNLAIDGIDDIYACVKDFYGYDMAHTTNLLVPPGETIRVEDIHPDEVPNKCGRFASG